MPVNLNEIIIKCVLEAQGLIESEPEGITIDAIHEELVDRFTAQYFLMKGNPDLVTISKALNTYPSISPLAVEMLARSLKFRGLTHGLNNCVFDTEVTGKTDNSTYHKILAGITISNMTWGEIASDLEIPAYVPIAFAFIGNIAHPTIGPVHKDTFYRAMLEAGKSREYIACLLGWDINIVKSDTKGMDVLEDKVEKSAKPRDAAKTPNKRGPRGIDYTGIEYWAIEMASSMPELQQRFGDVGVSSILYQLGKRHIKKDWQKAVADKRAGKLAPAKGYVPPAENAPTNDLGGKLPSEKTTRIGNKIHLPNLKRHAIDEKHSGEELREIYGNIAWATLRNNLKAQGLYEKWTEVRAPLRNEALTEKLSQAKHLASPQKKWDFSGLSELAIKKKLSIEAIRQYYKTQDNKMPYAALITDALKKANIYDKYCAIRRPLLDAERRDGAKRMWQEKYATLYPGLGTLAVDQGFSLETISKRYDSNPTTNQLTKALKTLGYYERWKNANEAKGIVRDKAAAELIRFVWSTIENKTENQPHLREALKYQIFFSPDGKTVNTEALAESIKRVYKAKRSTHETHLKQYVHGLDITKKDFTKAMNALKIGIPGFEYRIPLSDEQTAIAKAAGDVESSLDYHARAMILGLPDYHAIEIHAPTGKITHDQKYLMSKEDFPKDGNIEWWQGITLLEAVESGAFSQFEEMQLAGIKSEQAYLAIIDREYEIKAEVSKFLRAVETPKKA